MNPSLAAGVVEAQVLAQFVIPGACNQECVSSTPVLVSTPAAEMKKQLVTPMLESVTFLAPVLGLV